MRTKFLVIVLAGVAATAPASAQPGPWGRPGWGAMPPGGGFGYSRGRDPREGKIEVANYVANSASAAALGHGPIAVASAPGNLSIGSEDAIYQSAVAGELARVGYQALAGGSAGGQLAEQTVTHVLVEPEEPPHDSVSGQAGVGLSNRGSTVGIAVGIDMTKPLKALVATRLDAQIRDRVTHELLWEGHAKVVSREGDRRWSTQETAVRLAAALFKNFPRAS